MSANEKQVDGTHYRSGIQHWDFVIANDLDYFQGQITKYVTRWKKKNGIKDLEKAQHFLEKYIEAVRSGVTFTNLAVQTPAEVKTLAHYEVQTRYETEGFTLEGDWWRCKECRERFIVSTGANPGLVHQCGGATRSYVAQGQS